ncbi:transmembrane protein 216 isoform X2 [Meriones unguiculatus]|uniref:transmembrane protein 216 isoform X2 n=1 Tax=Meriones unguiculatus TaxID=10047 RepID=UPI00293ED226|nr:transmembrane protein 216 isoform X2 [Meriones unguiculatus]
MTTGALPCACVAGGVTIEWPRRVERPEARAAPRPASGSTTLLRELPRTQFPWGLDMAPRDKRLSSTPLEILLFLNGWYYATYFLLELLIFLYKGTKGNLCQRKMPLGISVALTFPSAMMASYYLLLQTYVLRLEAIMNSILLFFCGSELLLEMLTLATFSSMDRI